MDKKVFLKSINLVVTLPVAAISIILFISSRSVRYGFSSSKSKINQCELTPYEKGLIRILEVGEDHRFSTHFGFDPTAILRAMYKIVFCGKLEGASTIEQQFVRTCTGKTAVSITRKFEEISIATLISLTSSKESIAYSYLSHAYFGVDIIGYKNAIQRLTINQKSGHPELEEQSAIIAMLKHPLPKTPSLTWITRHENRTRHIHQRFLIVLSNS